MLAPIIEKRKTSRSNLDQVKRSFERWRKKAKAVAKQTMDEVHQKMMMG